MAQQPLREGLSSAVENKDRSPHTIAEAMALTTGPRVIVAERQNGTYTIRAYDSHHAFHKPRRVPCFPGGDLEAAVSEAFAHDPERVVVRRIKDRYKVMYG